KLHTTDIEDVIEEEERFIGKGGFGREEDNIEDVVVVDNNLCSSMIQSNLNVDFEEYINTKSHELMSFGKSIIIKTSPLVDDDLDKEEAIKVTEKKNQENDIEDETLEIDEVYVAQPPGFIDFEKPDHVYKLKKALYGLNKQPKLEMLKKFRLEDSKPMKTPMSSDTKLMKDKECESIDSTKYRGMIGSLLYLMASRPDIMFSVCLCARFQEDPKTSHLEEVKRIF
ncbi:retrovirus-related pol polyprotein from transposon TNT 1-94, partial [Tanacetum coccineum]